MRTNKIKEFYEVAIKEGKFSSKFFKGIKEILTEEELRNFIEEKVQPVAKEMGYNFSTDELVIYEKQMAKKITEQQLENISGGVDVKNLALGGIVSLMALGAGVAGATNSGDAMNSSTQNIQKTEPANVTSSPTTEEPTSTAQVSGSQIEQNENNTLTISDSKIELMEKFYEEITDILKNKRKDFIESIKNLQPKIKSKLLEELNYFYANEYNEFAKNVSKMLSKNDEYEKINEYYQNRKKQIDLILTYKIETNNIIDEIQKVFKAQKEKLKLKNDYDEDFYKLIGDEVNKVNKSLIETIDNGSGESDLESKIVEFKNRLNTKFKEEVMSKINVDKLKGAHKRARDRGDDPRKNNKKPKLAQFLEKNMKISSNKNEIKKELKTPFGEVWVELSKGLIFVRVAPPRYTKANYDEIAPKYVDIASCLDDYYKKEKKEPTLKMLNTILNYLNTKAEKYDTVKNAWFAVTFKNRRIGFKKNDEIMPNATQYERAHAAALCGILMVCESGEYRSENGGKRERGIIRTLIKWAEEGKSEHPFGDAFGRIDENGKYIEGIYTPAAQYNNSVRYGGTKRAQAIVGKISKENIKDEIFEKDRRDAGYLELSSDSEETQNDD